MHTVEHLIERHEKQMAKLERQLEKTAVKRQRIQDKREAKYTLFRQQLTEQLAPRVPTAAHQSGKVGLLAMVRTFLF